MKTWIPDERNFAYLNWKQVEALPKATTLLVLPTAAIEQHGHHLPLATDTLINNLLLGRALARLPPEAPVYALPPVCYGKSNEHLGFPGTISVSAATFMAVLRDIGGSISSAGFRKLVLYNTHGGNSALVDVMARDLRAEFGLRTFCLFGSGGAHAVRSQPAGAQVRLPCRRTRDRIPPPLHARACGYLRLHRQLHRPHRQSGSPAARVRTRHLLLAYP